MMRMKRLTHTHTAEGPPLVEHNRTCQWIHRGGKRRLSATDPNARRLLSSSQVGVLNRPFPARFWITLKGRLCRTKQASCQHPKHLLRYPIYCSSTRTGRVILLISYRFAFLFVPNRPEVDYEAFTQYRHPANVRIAAAQSVIQIYLTYDSGESVARPRIERASQNQPWYVHFTQLWIVRVSVASADEIADPMHALKRDLHCMYQLNMTGRRPL